MEAFKFIARLFKGFIFYLGVAVFIVLVLAIIQISRMSSQKPAPLPDEIQLTLNFDASIQDAGPQNPLQNLVGGKHKDFRTVIDTLSLAKDDARVKELFIHFYHESLSLAEIQEFRKAAKAFKATGKKIYVFADAIDDVRSYYLISLADQICLQPVGSIGMTGFYMAQPYLNKGLARIGVEPDFIAEGKYKSAPEMFTRDDMSAEAREENESLLQDLSDQLIAELAEDRGLSVEDMTRIFSAGPFTGKESQELRLIDSMGGPHNFQDTITALNPDQLYEQVPLFAYHAQQMHEDQEKAKKKSKNGTEIALIRASGEIAYSSVDQPHSLLGQEDMMFSGDVINAIDEAIHTPSVKGIIFHINSPGGSVTGSEAIRQKLLEAKKEGLPIIVVMGDVAASGGYWISMSADKIIAEPATITGSIGVFTGKFATKGLFDLLGVNWSELSTGGNADINSHLTKFSDSQRERLKVTTDDIYKSFIAEAAKWRHMSEEEVHAVAQGRVWTGRQAHKYGLVDELGGVEVAIEQMKQILELGEDSHLILRPTPHPLTPFEQFLELTSGPNHDYAAGVSLFAPHQMGFFKKLWVFWNSLALSVEQDQSLRLDNRAQMRPQH